MNKFIITLAALAALSTTSLASQRSDVDPRDRANSDINSASSSAYVNSDASESAAFAVDGVKVRSVTAFERVTMQSNQNENSHN